MREILQRMRLLLLGCLPAGPLRSHLRRAYWSLPRAWRESRLIPILVGALADRQRCRILQIGANDGLHADHLDPLFQAGIVTGWMVEPNPITFEQLRANRGSFSSVELVPVAIGESEGELPLYFHRADMGMASLSLAHVERHLPADLHLGIERAEVPVWTFQQLQRSCGIQAVDLLVIDTEGLDGRILRSIDFSSFECEVVLFERMHLGPQEWASTVAHLQEAGFRVSLCREDAVAIRHVSNLWNRPDLLREFRNVPRTDTSRHVR